MKVEVNHLRKCFDRTVAVDDITFAFDAGHIFGFVGPNGAGKTTTMRIIATLEEPTAGDVLVNGISVQEEPEQARRNIGYVPDSLPSHRDMTVEEYLDFFGRAYGLSGARLKRALNEVMDFTNLTEIREKLVRSLSKGMKQRVCLGRALIYDPPVLILDEPAAGLDPRARVELRELLALLAQRGKSILISSHILTELTEICHGVVIIERGKLLANGTIEEVLQRRSPKRTVAIRVLQPARELIQILLQTPHVDNVREVADEVHLEVDGPEDRSCRLLADLVRRGFQVAEFRQTRADLEDIFMQVTKGGVQ